MSLLTKKASKKTRGVTQEIMELLDSISKRCPHCKKSILSSFTVSGQLGHHCLNCDKLMWDEETLKPPPGGWKDKGTKK